MKRAMRPPDFYSYGVIDALLINRGKLAIQGWVASAASEIDALHISLDDEPVAEIAGPWLPSPDVKLAWPQLIGVSNCRFAVEVDLNPSELDLIERSAVISLTPKRGAASGVPLERVWPLRFNAPGEKESDQVGQGDFIKTSFEYLSILRHVAALGRDESILDAGCGLGRMAYALAHYLNSAGTYQGFDISTNLIEDAADRFRSLPHFQFRHVDVFNRMYNPTGGLNASSFQFPYPSASFDLAFLTSVFTHMLPADLRHYLREIRRVLKNDGRCLATFFILDAETENLLSAGHGTLPLTHRTREGCLVRNPLVPEEAIAYPIETIREMCAEAGLQISFVHPGHWPGRDVFFSYQDVCLLKAASN
jgi:SAM-dependent methyltransferase